MVSLGRIMTSVPYIMISYDLDKGIMVNHDLARLTMIMASVSWLRTLGMSIALITFSRRLHGFSVVDFC